MLTVTLLHVTLTMNLFCLLLLVGSFVTSAVIIGPHDTAVMVGSKATFSCSINSSEPCLTWRYRLAPDNQLFYFYVCYLNWSSALPWVQFSSPKCNVAPSDDKRTSLLTIIDVQFNDAGLYSCTHCYSDNTNEARLAVVESKGCQWNISSPDHSVTKSDVFVIECEVGYVSEWWTPVIHCLPDRAAGIFRDEIYNRSTSAVTINLLYRETFNVSSFQNNVKFDCYISFTASNIGSDNLITPATIHLWMSPAISITDDHYTRKASPTTEYISVCFVALVILSSLLAVSLVTIIALTVGLLRAKGKSTCMKDPTYEATEISTGQVPHSVYTELAHPVYTEIAI